MKTENLYSNFHNNLFRTSMIDERIKRVQEQRNRGYGLILNPSRQRHVMLSPSNVLYCKNKPEYGNSSSLYSPKILSIYDDQFAILFCVTIFGIFFLGGSQISAQNKKVFAGKKNSKSKLLDLEVSNRRSVFPIHSPSYLFPYHPTPGEKMIFSGYCRTILTVLPAVGIFHSMLTCWRLQRGFVGRFTIFAAF